MNKDIDTSFVQDALPAFLSEAHEQIAAIEQLLLQLEDDPGNHELLNALFRCAHTVKGSAGIFGLDRVVAFTHHVESLLDRLREGELSLTPLLSTLLLKCNDQIQALVGQAGADVEDAEGDAVRADLVQQLQAVSADVEAPPADVCAEAADTQIAPKSAAQGGPGTATGHRRWHLAVSFGQDTYRNGMDPLAILNYLRGLGEIATVTCDVAGVPPLDQIDPESCHLTFEIGLDTAAQRNEIESAFSFVRDDCVLHIVEPGGTPDDFIGLI
ncbi:MAG: Hpt domain-containing protein, partial [Rhodoferax sp.]|nr:Hpt domain-containing protein [Rhodoferax sp.]